MQVWILEGRDYRSPNSAEDVAGKSIWGAEQREWLQKSLVQSPADFKLVVSPTPMVGPDDARKKDSHANVGGFSVEGAAFRQFLVDNGLAASTFLVCGDRHWQYHSIDPQGVEEFCCGTACGQNSRYGVAPGNPAGSDPQARIRQPYLQPNPGGAFIQVTLDRSRADPSLLLQYLNEFGQLQYAVRKEIVRRPAGTRPG